MEALLRHPRLRVHQAGQRLAIVFVTLAAGTNLFSPAVADEGYPFDMKKRYGKAFSAYQKIVPAKFKKTKWIYSFDGTAGPMDVVQSGGKKCLIGSVCQPHDCGDNQVAFLLAADGSSAVGLLRSRNLTQGKDILFGKPDAAQLTLLQQRLN